MKKIYKLITIRLFILVALFIGATGLQAQPDNILVNGDFTNSMDDWTATAVVSYYKGIRGFDIDGPGPKTLSNAFYGRAVSSSNIVNLRQTVSLTEGRTYLVSADIASYVYYYYSTIPYAGIVEISIGGTTVASRNLGANVSYTSPVYSDISGTFVAPSTGSFVFNIKIYRPYYYPNTNQYVYVDNVMLEWQAPQVNLNLAVNPSGAGTVDKTPDKPTYNQGETVQLTANPGFGYMFSNWSGDVSSTDNPLDLLMDDHKTVTANFDPANVLVKFSNSSNVGIEGGVVEYYDRGWQNAGMTDANGELRFNYEGRRSRLNFRLTYNGETMSQNNVRYLYGPVLFQLEEVPIQLLSSTGDGLPGGLVEVFNGGWTELGTTDADGKVIAGIPPGYYSIRMTYEGMTETKSNVDISSPVIFQTLNMVARLEFGSIGGIPDGEVMFQTPAMAWSAFGTTGNNGNTSKELLPGVYDFSMTFQSSTEEMNEVDISVTNPLVFEPAPGSEISFITENKISNPDGVNNGFAFELESVGISDEFAIVGARSDKGPNGTGYYTTGAAYIFRKVAGDWQYQTKLYADDWTYSYDQFGYSVDIDGNYAVVGAVNNNSRGAVYVFFWNGTSWMQQVKITPPNSYTGDYFGNSVAISGDQIIVGQFLYSNNRGAVHFYKRTGSTWSIEQSIYGGSSQRLGRDVDISGNRAIVGTGNYVYIYEKTTSWAQIKYIYKGSNFGYDVAISGDYAVVGAKLAGSYRGRAYVYYRGAGAWVEQAELMSPNPYYNERFGQDVDIWGDKVIVGNLAYISNVDKEGAAYLFNREGTNWVFNQKFRASDGTANNHFGKAVAISENDVLVGATGADSYTGAAYFYSFVSVEVPEGAPKSGIIAAEPDVNSSLGLFSLADNYPNPFSATTKIRFTVKDEGKTNLRVYNAFGKEITVLYSGNAEPGIPYEFSFNGSQLPDGLYIYRLQNGNQSISKKMLLRK